MIVCLGVYSMTVWFGLVCPHCGQVMILGINTLGNATNGLTVASGVAVPEGATR